MKHRHEVIITRTTGGLHFGALWHFIMLSHIPLVFGSTVLDIHNNLFQLHYFFIVNTWSWRHLSSRLNAHHQIPNISAWFQNTSHK